MGWRRYVAAGLASAALTVVAYLAVVVLATPTFEATFTIKTALDRNGPVVAVVALGVGTLVALVLANRDQGCAVDDASAAGAGGGAFGVFASMFALTSVGCCGLFAFWMSLVFGAGAVSFLVAHSMALTGVGLLVMAASIGVLAYRVHQGPGGRVRG